MERLNINLRIFFIGKNIFNRESESNKIKFHNTNTSEMFFFNAPNTEFKTENNRKLQKYNILVFEDENKALEHLKTLKFIPVIIIVAEDLFDIFVKKLKDNLNYIYIIPRIIIFGQESNFCSLRNICLKCCKKRDDEFYHCGGKASSLDEIYNFIESLKNQNIQNDIIIQSVQLTRSTMREGNYLFEQIRKTEDLILPTFYKILLDISETKNNSQFIQKIYMNYNNKSDYNNLLRFIINMPSIPVELLSKYYARLYTIEGGFYKNMKNSLLNADKNNKEYMPYIKTLYEGVEKGALKTCIGQKLYSAAYFSERELNDLNKYKNERISDLPMSIIFSKSFMSFSKNKNVAESFFYIGENKNTLLIVEDAKIEYDLLTHADIEELSFFPNEKEVVFFPFSAFGIQDFEYDYYKNRYIIRLIYLGKYIKQFENDKKFNASSDKLPNSYYKDLLKQSGLVEEKTIEKIKIKEISKKYKVYKENRNQANKCCSKKLIISLIIILVIILVIDIALGIILPLALDENDEECKEGYYLVEDNSTCIKCPDGQSSNTNSISCFLCPAGTFSNIDYEICMPCFKGFYNPEEGAAECLRCPLGQSSGYGASSCSNCTAGTYSNNENFLCKDCPKGHFSVAGAAVCQLCPDGTYADEEGTETCKNCGDNYHSNDDRTACIENFFIHLKQNWCIIFILLLLNGF